MSRRKLSLVVAMMLLAGAPAAATSLEEAEQAIRERRFESAAEILEVLSQQGDPNAQYRLGSMYRTGRGVPMNHGIAISWLLRSAKGGNWHAQYSLGTMYQNGWGVAADRDEAVNWYRTAALRGHALAAERLRQGNPEAFAPSVAPGVPGDNISDGGTEVSFFRVSWFDPDVFQEHMDTIGMRVDLYKSIRVLDSFNVDRLGGAITGSRIFNETVTARSVMNSTIAASGTARLGFVRLGFARIVGAFRIRG